ncbi:hypothetical protein JW905_18815 [bacterium]|nr:hypothetical protein [candidate division CSSED10-310 bacterium]
MGPKASTRSIPGYSFVALIKQALRDGRVHSSSEIAAFVRRFVGQYGTLKSFEQDTIVPLLHSRICFVKVASFGYQLDGGDPINDEAMALLLRERNPMTIKQIKRALAPPPPPRPVEDIPAAPKTRELDYDDYTQYMPHMSTALFMPAAVDTAAPEEPVEQSELTEPAGMEFTDFSEEDSPDIELYLDDDGRFIDYHSQGEVYWYPNSLLNVNDYVHSLIHHLGPLRRAAIFPLLHEIYHIEKEVSIFLPEVDQYITTKGRKYYLVSKGEQPIMVLSQEDFAPAHYFLREDSRQFSIAALAHLFFNKPLEQTDLQSVLQRQPDLRIDDGHVRFDPKFTPTHVDLLRVDAVIDKAAKLAQKLTGSVPSHLLVEAVTTSAKGPIAGLHMELLKRLDKTLSLVRDQYGLRLLTETKNAGGGVLPIGRMPLAPRIEETDREAFLQQHVPEKWDDDERQPVEREHDRLLAVRLILTPLEHRLGVLRLDELLRDFFPHGFSRTEMEAIDPDRDVRFPVLVDHDTGYATGFQDYFTAHIGSSGAILYLRNRPLDTYQFEVHHVEHELDPLSVFDENKLNEMAVLEAQHQSEGLSIAEAIWLLMVTRDMTQTVHRNTIWAELNSVFPITRREVVALLEGLACFKQHAEEKVFGLYYVDPDIPLDPSMN